MNIFDSAKDGNLERVMLLVQQGAEKDQQFGKDGKTALIIAAGKGHADVVRFLVEQGACIDKPNYYGCTPLMYATSANHIDVVRYLLEQGANRDMADITAGGYTSLHLAAIEGHLEIAKLLMICGADLNVRSDLGKLPIDMVGRDDEEMRQAILNEPQRRWDQQPRKRCFEEERQTDAAASVSSNDEQGNEGPSLDEEVEAEDEKIAEEDEDSEPSDEEDGN
jgi:ankyrin repeat protein